MLRSGFPELSSRLHFGHHLSWRRAVTGSDAVPLAIECGRVMDLEKIFKQLPVAQLPGIEGNLDRLGVASMVAVSRIGNVTAPVTDPSRDYARVTPQEILHTPETKHPPARIACSSVGAMRLLPFLMLDACARTACDTRRSLRSQVPQKE